MRKRCLLWFAASIAGYAWFTYSFFELRRGPFGDEFGSVAYPFPPLLEGLRDFAGLSLLISLVLFVYDFLVWRKSR